MKMNQFLDATYLKTAKQAGVSEDENWKFVSALTKEAIALDYKLLMIRATYIARVKKKLQRAGASTLIGTVIGFYKGTNTLIEKLEEAQQAIDLGADELDFVLNYREFKKGNFDLIDQELLFCTRLCIKNHKVIKWIIETAALTNEEIVVISQRIRKVVLANFTNEVIKSVFVKSSTGFFHTENKQPNGATLSNIQLILANARPLKVKAAGGVRTFEMAQKMIAIGVDRIGTSSAKEIVTKEIHSQKRDSY